MRRTQTDLKRQRENMVKVTLLLRKLCMEELKHKIKFLNLWYGWNSHFQGTLMNLKHYWKQNSKNTTMVKVQLLLRKLGTSENYGVCLCLQEDMCTSHTCTLCSETESSEADSAVYVGYGKGCIVENSIDFLFFFKSAPFKCQLPMGFKYFISVKLQP